MSDISIPGGRIRSFVERVEHLDTELQELNESKKEVFSEAKAEGFDVKILKEIIKLRKQDKDERDERDTLLDMYMRAMDTAGPQLAAKAACGPAVSIALIYISSRVSRSSRSSLSCFLSLMISLRIFTSKPSALASEKTSFFDSFNSCNSVSKCSTRSTKERIRPPGMLMSDMVPLC